MEDRPRTTFIVANDRDALVLEKMAAIEEAVGELVPILAKILTYLESQAQPKPTPVASYEQLYGPIEEGPPEGELVAAVMEPTLVHRPPWWRLFFWHDVPKKGETDEPA